jgi:hypothetical protein
VSTSQYQSFLQRLKNESSLSRSAAEQKPDHAGAQYNSLACIVALKTVWMAWPVSPCASQSSEHTMNDNMQKLSQWRLHWQTDDRWRRRPRLSVTGHVLCLEWRQVLQCVSGALSCGQRWFLEFWHGSDLSCLPSTILWFGWAHLGQWSCWQLEWQDMCHLHISIICFHWAVSSAVTTYIAGPRAETWTTDDRISRDFDTSPLKLVQYVRNSHYASNYRFRLAHRSSKACWTVWHAWLWNALLKSSAITRAYAFDVSMSETVWSRVMTAAVVDPFGRKRKPNWSLKSNCGRSVVQWVWRGRWMAG